jgi:hypothetical protein
MAGRQTAESRQPTVYRHHPLQLTLPQLLCQLLLLLLLLLSQLAQLQ